MTSLMDVRNLIKLTLSAVNVYKDIVTGDTQSILEKTQKVMLEYNVKPRKSPKVGRSRGTSKCLQPTGIG